MNSRDKTTERTARKTGLLFLPWHMRQGEGTADGDFARMKLSAENILLLFLFGGFAGTLIETVFCILVEHRFAWRAGLILVPFNPVYGCGTLILYFSLRTFRRKQKGQIFLVSYILGTAVEYFFSWLQEVFLGSVTWDYSGLPLNLHGRVCLFYSLGWGILGLLWTLYVSPALETAIMRIPPVPKRRAVIIAMSVVIVAMLWSALAILAWRARSLALPTPFFAKPFEAVLPDGIMSWFYPSLSFTA